MIEAANIELPKPHYAMHLAPRVRGLSEELAGHYGFALEIYSDGRLLVAWDEPDEAPRLVHLQDVAFFPPTPA